MYNNFWNNLVPLILFMPLFLFALPLFPHENEGTDYRRQIMSREGPA